MSKKLHAFLLCCLFLISAQTFAQEREVTGKVSDGSGMPIPGVSVYVKGTTVGTTTDFDGEFSLNVTGEDPVLVFSYIGFQPKEISVEGQDFFEVTLEDDVQALEEIVVVGYGVQKRANLTGAVSTVDTEVLEARPEVAGTGRKRHAEPGVAADLESHCPELYPVARPAPRGHRRPARTS